MLFLLGPDGLDALPVTSQHLLREFYPEPPPGRSYSQLKLKCKNLLMEECDKAGPDLARYPYPPSLKPHPFMGLDQFTSGHLHQMRSGKSYLRAHPSWDTDAPTTVTTLRIGSYSGLNSSPYGIPSGNHIEDRPVYLVYYR